VDLLQEYAYPAIAFASLFELLHLYYGSITQALIILFIPISLWIIYQLTSKRSNRIKTELKDAQIKRVLDSSTCNTRTYRKEHEQFIEENSIDYDPTDTPSLRNFSTIMKKSDCLFARSANIWGNCEWNHSLSFEDNIIRSLKILWKGLKERNEVKLDGFVFEIPGVENCDTVETFGETVRKVLTIISNHDPACFHSMDHDDIGRRGWSFTFDQIYIFVTCFAPCYPPTNARYSYESKDSCFVLLQPQSSFELHDIGEDHGWDDSKDTMRQKIRNNFKKNGRLYLVPDARIYAAAPMIVPPLNLGEPFLKWYVPRPTDNFQVEH